MGGREGGREGGWWVCWLLIWTHSHAPPQVDGRASMSNGHIASPMLRYPVTNMSAAIRVSFVDRISSIFDLLPSFIFYLPVLDIRSSMAPASWRKV